MTDGKIDQLMFKQEDQSRGIPIGPLWKRVGGVHVNYADSTNRAFDGGFYPKWYTLRDAQRIAKQLGVPLVER